MKLRNIKKVAIIGVGFMGGSLALALKRKFPKFSIWGYARNIKSYRKLKKLNILDEVERDLKKVVEEADLIIMSLPVYVIVEYLKKISPWLKKKVIVFDMGSTKEVIERGAAKYLPQDVGFVACHPLCGGERSGAEFSQERLYQGALCIITSSPNNKASKLVKEIWERLGCKVVFLSATTHDKILSSVSHLPHLLSFSLTYFIPQKFLKFALASLKDLTRISNSSPFLWRDIFFSNKKNILQDIDEFIKILNKFKKVIKKEDKKEILNLIKKVNVKYRQIANQ